MAAMLPLVDMTTIYGEILTFDRARILMIVPAAPRPGLPARLAPSNATEVVGITRNPVFVSEQPTTILDKFNIRSNFLPFTFTGGYKVWVKAVAVGWISPNASPQNPKAKCTIGVGWQPLPVLEDCAAIRSQVDAARKAYNDGSH